MTRAAAAMERTRRDGRRPHGFTLVELLIVIAVIGILIGVLLPALANAKEAGRKVMSLKQMRDLTAAALTYTYDHDEQWPVIPAIFKPDRYRVAFVSFNYGGKTSSDHWFGPNYIEVQDRLLNEYVYPDKRLADPEPGPNGEQRRLELPAYRCPSDQRTFQRNFWRTGEPDPISSYDDVGTSYHMNVKWWFASARGGENDLERWERTRFQFRKGGLGGPSRFVWLYDQIMDVVTITARSFEGDHGGTNKAKVAFMDGHVEYLRVEPGEVNTNDYWLLLE